MTLPRLGNSNIFISQIFPTMEPHCFHGITRRRRSLVLFLRSHYRNTRRNRYSSIPKIALHCITQIWSENQTAPWKGPQLVYKSSRGTDHIQFAASVKPAFAALCDQESALEYRWATGGSRAGILPRNARYGNARLVSPQNVSSRDMGDGGVVS